MISNEFIVNWISCVEDFLDDDEDVIFSRIVVDVRWPFRGSSIGLLSNTESESLCEIRIFDAVEVEFDILDVGLIGGKSLIVADAILFISSLLSAVVVVVLGNELRLALDVIEAMEPFFDAIRDDLCRFIVVTVKGVVFGGVDFVWERGVNVVDVRVDRPVNKRSDGFAELIERIEAMSKSWEINRTTLKIYK